MKPIVLWRPHDPLDPTEENAIKGHFDLVRQRTEVGPGRLVIGRYSVLPFYKELEQDILNQGSKLINTYSEHLYVADLQNWYYDLQNETPVTMFTPEDTFLFGRPPFVVKGETNSRKFQWNTHMFALNKIDAVDIANELLQDSLLSTQNIYVRQYVPLVKLAEGLNGMPITEEYRFFILDGYILSGAFYWSSHVADVEKVPDPWSVPGFFDWFDEVLNRTCTKIRFYVVDVARTAEGKWIVIEMNDGQMSGLSENDPTILYGAMKEVLRYERT